MATTKVYDTLIVGAGFTGIGTAIKLTQAGVDDIVILERDDRVGGTWRDNTYPGAACDIPSLLYSFSFVKNPNWSRAYSPAGEICEHIEDMVDAVRPAPAHPVRRRGQRADFDEDEGVWTLTTMQRKRFRARTVVLASGPLPDHKLPGHPRSRHLSRATRSTAPAGTTTTTSPASGSRSSAPAPAPCRSSPNWSSRPSSSRSSSARPAGCCRGWTSRCPPRRRSSSRKCLPPNSLPARRCSGATRSARPPWCGTPRSPRWSPGWARRTSGRR